MSDHYIVTADHAHLRIFAERQPPGQQQPALEQIEAMDFPQGKHGYSDRDTDMAGRFAGSKPQSSGPGRSGIGIGRTGGMSIDERLPMEREERRRRAKEIAAEIDAFFAQRNNATWDFAAGPDFNSAVLELLTRDTRERLRRSVSKDLVNQRVDELRAHFAEKR
jgi:hypothetical protein